MKNGTREWICGSMQLCPVLVSVLSCHLQVSYANIKRWRKFQNVTRFLWRAALHFLSFELSINKNQRTGFPLKMSLIFQRHYSTYTILQCIRYQLCYFLVHKISTSPSSSYSWTWWLTGDWRNWHQAHDGSIPSSYLSYLQAFLNKKASLSCKLIWCTESVCCFTLIDTQSCVMDTVMAVCAEHAHRLICVDMTRCA